MLENAVKLAAQKNGFKAPGNSSKLNRNTCFNTCKVDTSPMNTSQYQLSASNTLIVEEEALMKELDALQQHFPVKLKEDSDIGEYLSPSEHQNKLKLSTIKEIESQESKINADSATHAKGKIQFARALIPKGKYDVAPSKRYESS